MSAITQTGRAILPALYRDTALYRDIASWGDPYSMRLAQSSINPENGYVVVVVWRGGRGGAGEGRLLE